MDVYEPQFGHVKCMIAYFDFYLEKRACVNRNLTIQALRSGRKTQMTNSSPSHGNTSEMPLSKALNFHLLRWPTTESCIHESVPTC